MVAKVFFSRQFLYFLVAGGLAACINFMVGAMLSGYLPWYGDIVVGYLAGMATAFFLFEQRVFGEHRESRKKSAGIFLLVNMLGLLQTWLVFVLLKDYIFPASGYRLYPDELARAVAIIVPTLTSFVGHKYFTFK